MITPPGEALGNRGLDSGGEVVEAESRRASPFRREAENVDSRHWDVLGRGLHAYGLLIAWGAVTLGFGIALPNRFLTTANFGAIFSLQAELVILALALLLPLVTGEFDLSVAGTMGIAFVLMGDLNANHGVALWLAAVAALAAGVAVGLVNSLLVVGLGLDSIVVTLGTGTVLIGLGFAFLNGPATGLSPRFVSAMTYQIAGVAITFWIALVITVLLWYLFRYTPTGRHMYFVGANREAARLAGLRVKRLRAGALFFAAVLSAIDGVVLAGATGGADPNTASAYLFAAFAGVFLGGTSITPGRFNPWGTFIAVYFLATGVTGLELLGQTGWVEQVFYGVALIIGVVASRLLGRTAVRGI